MDWKYVGSLVSAIMLLLFFAMLGITLLHFYPLIGIEGVCMYALLLSLSWVAAYVAVKVLKLLSATHGKLLVSIMALFLLLQGLLDEMTLLGPVVLTLLLLGVSFLLAMLWLQELRYWTTFGLKKEKVTQFSIVGGVVLLSILIYAFSSKEREAESVVRQASPAVPIRQLYYGSGYDTRRAAYRDSAALITPTVNATHLVKNWSGIHGYFRTRFWGFGTDSLPLNAQVWYPATTGKKPLVLIAHGNHLDQDFSEGGFAYLGTYLAAQGYIVASVDENFLNSSWAELLDGIQGDIPARAWLLLKHLEVWGQWNSSPGNPFYNQIDMQHIALIGHSRGAEAVAWAHYLNELPYEYNKPQESRNKKFAINSIISITPTDGYRAGENGLLQLMDVSYLQVQSGRDIDLLYHSGQYERVRFSGSNKYLKAKLVVLDGNHNQFNESWGSYDVLFPNSLFVSLEGQLSAWEQQQVARTAVHAFFQSSFTGDASYVNWVEHQSFPGQFQYSNALELATFEEDQNLTSGTQDSTLISARHFTTWEEKQVLATTPIANGRALHLTWDSTANQQPLEISLENLHLSCNQVFLTMDILLKDTSQPAEMVIEVTDVEGRKEKHTITIPKAVKPADRHTESILPFFPANEVQPKLFQTVKVPLSVSSLSSIKLIIKTPQRGSLWLDNLQLQKL
jgi:hypothetical protein